LCFEEAVSVKIGKTGYGIMCSMAQNSSLLPIASCLMHLEDIKKTKSKVQVKHIAEILEVNCGDEWSECINFK
jgi:hypothetical protein